MPIPNKFKRYPKARFPGTRGGRVTSAGLKALQKIGGNSIGFKTPNPIPPPFAGVTFSGLALKAAVVLFILNLTAKGTSDGTIPEHIRNPGEKQKIQDASPPPFKGGQESNKHYHAYGSYEHTEGKRYWWATTGNFGFKGKITDTLFLDPKDNGGNRFIFGATNEFGKTDFSLINRISYERATTGDYPTTISSFSAIEYSENPTSYNKGKNPKLIGFYPTTGEDTGGDPPSTDDGIETEAGIDFSDVNANDYEFFDKVRFVRNGAPSVIKPPKINLSPPPKPKISGKPGIIPQPQPQEIPNPSPPPETALDQPPPPPLPQQQDTNKTNKRGRKITKYLPSTGNGVSVFLGNPEPAPNPAPPPNPNPAPNDGKPELYDQKDNFNKTPKPSDKKIFSPPPPPPELDKEKIIKEDPKPDAEDNKPPFIPPPPVQSPPDKCKGTCAGKNGIKLDGLNALLNGTGVAQNQGIYDIVKNTNDAVRSTSYGLQKIQGFAETAWKSTRADKIMNGLTMVMSVHNAIMLSNNLASTISEALNMSLNALGITDETAVPIDIGTAVRSKLNSILKDILGETNYLALTARLAKANRIYQSSINLLDTTYSLFDSARNIAESTAEYTGKIGNALRDAGAVYEDAYEEMIEKITPQNRGMQGIGKFGEALESAENIFDSVAQISGEVVDFKENVEQLRTEKNELGEQIIKEIETKELERDTAKTENQVQADIDSNDFAVATDES